MGICSPWEFTWNWRDREAKRTWFCQDSAAGLQTGGGMARDDSMLGYISKCCSQQHRPGDHVMVMHSYISMNKSWNQLIRARSQIPLSAPLEAESLSRKAQACLRAREKNRRASENRFSLKCHELKQLSWRQIEQVKKKNEPAVAPADDLHGIII